MITLSLVLIGVVLLVLKGSLFALRFFGVKISAPSFFSKKKEKNLMASGNVFEINEKEFELKLKRENGDILEISFITCKEWFLKREFKLNERISVPCHPTMVTL